MSKVNKLYQKVSARKVNFEKSGLRVNMNKTEVMFMFGGASMGTLVHTTLLYGLVMFASQVWKQINLLLRCQHWVHKMCHGIRGRIVENKD